MNQRMQTDEGSHVVADSLGRSHLHTIRRTGLRAASNMTSILFATLANTTIVYIRSTSCRHDRCTGMRKTAVCAYYQPGPAALIGSVLSVLTIYNGYCGSRPDSNPNSNAER
jgi:hypothetical protein